LSMRRGPNDFWRKCACDSRSCRLSLHPEKDQADRVRTLAATERERRGKDKPETCFFGLCPDMRKSHRGRFLIPQEDAGRPPAGYCQTRERGLRRADASADSAREDGWRQVGPGYFAYHAVPTNARRSGRPHHVSLLEANALSAQPEIPYDVDRMAKNCVDDWLPHDSQSCILGGATRFNGKHPSGSRVPKSGPLDLCGGAQQWGLPRKPDWMFRFDSRYGVNKRGDARGCTAH